MCGIIGRYNLDGENIVYGNALRSLEIIRHRGPDDWGMLFAKSDTGAVRHRLPQREEIIVDEDIILGHTRLSIIDLAGGHQPMADKSNRCHIVFNGEIYNYIELRNDLENKGYHFRTAGDTEVILNAYLEFGTDCVKHFNGIFAFSIYDSRSGALFCARDHLGVKPFYYYHDPNKFVFASEIKSILCWDDITAEPDYGAMLDYLTFLFYLDDRTLFKNIKSLPPAFSMTIDKSGVKLQRYWTPDLCPDYSLNRQKAAEKVRELVTDAVRLQMRSDVDIGTHLSSGVDSSTIASLVSRMSGSRIYSFTGRFKNGGVYDELPLARASSKILNTRLHVVTPSPDDFKKYIRNLIWSCDYPSVGPGVFPQFMVSKTAASKLKVVLGGQGGDEVFLGYPRYLRTIIEDRIVTGRKDRAIAGTSDISLLRHYYLNYGVGGFAGWLLKRKTSRFSERYALSSARLYGLESYYAGHLLNEYKNYNPITAAIESIDSIESDSLSNIMTWFDLKYYLPALLQIEDRTSMAWSLESRVPLLDFRIVEFALKIPPEIKFHELKLKSIFLAAMGDILPEPIRKNIRKIGFATPIGIWFENELRDFVSKILCPENLRKRNLLDESAISDFFKSRKKWLTLGVPRDTLLWSLLNLELWYQVFIDGRIEDSRLERADFGIGDYWATDLGRLDNIAHSGEPCR